MPTYGHAQILGLSEDVQKAWAKERAALRKMGVDPDVGLSQMQARHEQTVALNAQQESLKRQQQATTAIYVAARDKLYVTCSGALDTLMAAVEKNSPAAKNLQRLRSRIRRPQGPSVAAPLPVATPPA
jgi:hypothetical protein